MKNNDNPDLKTDRRLFKGWESLFARKGLDGFWRLQDQNYFTIGTFRTAIECEKWCNENGYRCIVTA